MAIKMENYLSLAPIFFNLSDDEFVSFYEKIASYEKIKDVHIGEVVCVKRAKKQEIYDKVIKILEKKGKKIYISTPALITDKNDKKYLQKIISQKKHLLEINEMTAFALKGDNKFSIGNFINIYNENTASYFDKIKEIEKITLPVETGLSQIKEISKNIKTPIEYSVFGKLPLAVSARCYLAKHYNKNKKTCEMVCEKHQKGLDLKTIDKKDILCVTGTMTLSAKSFFLEEKEIKELIKNDVKSFRLIPTGEESFFQALEYYSKIIEGKRTEKPDIKSSFNDYFYS